MIKDIAKVEEIIEYYAGERNPKEQENLVAMLREIQEVEGYISREVQEMQDRKNRYQNNGAVLHYPALSKSERSRLCPRNGALFPEDQMWM